MVSKSRKRHVINKNENEKSSNIEYFFQKVEKIGNREHYISAFNLLPFTHAREV